MNRNFTLPALLSLCLLAVPPLAMADQTAQDDHMMEQEDMGHGNMNSPDMDDHHARPDGQHHGQGDFDPVKRTEKHLGMLEKELKLNDDQQSAWKAYSDSILGYTKEKSSRIEQLRKERGELSKMDMASKLDKLAQMSRSRADRLAQLASDTRTFEQALTPEQQTRFNQFWMKQMSYGKKRRHPQS